jgi:23S rRNA (uracil1939-C5)-methyltransferase
VYGGDGLARIDGGDEPGAGKVVLVPYVLPGELAKVDAGDDVHAGLIEVTERSPDRVEPPCQYFARCGGCHYQHAPYEFQVARKVEILREQLRRVGKFEYAGEIEAITGPPLGYRNRAQFHIEGTRIGYRAARSHELIDIAECPISSPKLNETLKLIRERIRDPKFPKFVHAIEIFTNEREVQLNAIDADRPVARPFYEWMGSTVALQYGEFRVSPRSFFQVNRFLIDAIVKEALQGASGESALDLYAGVGLFGLPLARSFKDVVAVEAGSAAVRDLEVNAEQAGVKVQVEQARVEDFVAQLVTKSDKTPDFVLADPPRAGLGKSVVANLNRLAAPKLTIVSCDPATLARDLAGFVSGEAAKYQIDRMALVDLFPQTYHLETIAHLSLT